MLKILWSVFTLLSCFFSPHYDAGTFPKTSHFWIRICVRKISQFYPRNCSLQIQTRSQRICSTLYFKSRKHTTRRRLILTLAWRLVMTGSDKICWKRKKKSFTILPSDAQSYDISAGFLVNMLPLLFCTLLKDKNCHLLLSSECLRQTNCPKPEITGWIKNRMPGCTNWVILQKSFVH